MKESKEKKDIIDLEKNHSIIEKYFERALWGTRYVVVSFISNSDHKGYEPKQY